VKRGTYVSAQKSRTPNSMKRQNMSASGPVHRVRGHTLVNTPAFATNAAQHGAVLNGTRTGSLPTDVLQQRVAVHADDEEQEAEYARGCWR
jgi:hypothetical protein